MDNDGPVRQRAALDALLQHVTMQHRSAEAARTNRLDAISSARAFGASWEEIGAACGMSRQTAYKRFGIADRGSNHRADL